MNPVSKTKFYYPVDIGIPKKTVKMLLHFSLFFFLDYNPPAPPKGVGYHRYIFTVYGHTKPARFYEKITQRCGFDIDLFSGTHKLEPIPDARVMFRTRTE